MSKAFKAQKKVTTVWLESEVSGYKDKEKMFFCFNCRIPVLQYSGSVMKIIPGEHPYNPSTIVKCKGNAKNIFGEWEECGMFYSFIATVFTKNYQST